MNTLKLNSKMGVLGEEIATKFLLNKGFTLLDRNYLKKWGEIDIVAEKAQKIHFVEVKSISRENNSNVSYETYDAVERITTKKLQKLKKVIETYLLEKQIEKEHQIDALIVEIYIKDKKAHCRWVENVL